ncbi:MAG: hypothetical protein PHR35_07545 [Kiritimatiellae bacterium]|nr:hypothetical protein [Kiritimatiellia bacterium]
MRNETRTQEFYRCSIRLWGIITAAGVLAGAASLLGFLGAFNWFMRKHGPNATYGQKPA